MAFLDKKNAPTRQIKAKITENEVLLRRVLKASPQDLWLDTIRRTQTDTHDSLIHWMLSQIECDFSIAVHAFYRSNPARYLDDPKPLPMRPGPSDIFALVLLNWDTGSYRTHRLQVNATDVKPRLLARINQKVMARQRGSLPFNIPERFLRPKGGVPLQLPHHMSPDDAHHLWPIYADLGLRVPDAAPGLKRKVARAKKVLQKVGFKTHRT